MLRAGHSLARKWSLSSLEKSSFDVLESRAHRLGYLNCFFFLFLKSGKPGFLEAALTAEIQVSSPVVSHSYNYPSVYVLDAKRTFPVHLVQNYLRFIFYFTFSSEIFYISY